MTDADCFGVEEIGWSRCDAEDVAASKALESRGVEVGRSVG